VNIERNPLDEFKLSIFRSGRETLVCGNSSGFFKVIMNARRALNRFRDRFRKRKLSAFVDRSSVDVVTNGDAEIEVTARVWPPFDREATGSKCLDFP